MELFDKDKKLISQEKKEEFLKNIPLAERLRPTEIKDFLGNSDIINNIIKNSTISLIFWGPTGVGKTTLAKLIANHIDADFISESAISAGVSDIRKILYQAEFNFTKVSKKTLLFLDEIHHFNRSQQDVLLKAVEEGTILLIGATTENPSFKINNALLSRCQVYKFDKLSDDDLDTLIDRVFNEDRIFSKMDIVFESGVRELLIEISNGDARVLLNTLEQVLNNLNIETPIISKNAVRNVYKSRTIQYDMKGDYHYDVISAFIKSLRGSDPDAAVYYLALMLEGGEDILFIARRMVILASEDIGNANPMALNIATSCYNAVNVVGLPEARLILAQTVLYLASSPKSNAVLKAINRATKEVKKHGMKEVPYHLRNAPTRLMKEMGYGKEYQYPHDFDENFVEDDYFPEGLDNTLFYTPSENGSEKKIKEYLEKIWKDRYL